VRDPLVIFEGAIEEVDDETQTEHFESIQSTNWQSVRWKPPPPRSGPNDPHIGWRTEFRSMEIQLTDFENAAFTTFITLLTRVILTFDLNLYIPLSRVDANMQRAHGRNAAVKGKFFFRRHMAPLEKGDDGFGEQYVSMFSNGKKRLSTVLSGEDLHVLDTKTSSVESESGSGVSEKRRVAPNASGGAEENSYEEMTMAEIMTGKGDYFPGLIPLVYAYLDHIQCDSLTLERVTKYLDFIEKRATGKLVTPATWIRNFIRNHEDYAFDSVITDSIAYDLMVACKEIGEGARAAPELLGDVVIKPINAADAYAKKLESKRVDNGQILSLLERYSARKQFGEAKAGAVEYQI
jgi:glutamate--cysteine ligase catalytic subunit